MNLELNQIDLKRCPRCEESLPVSEYGICRARRDGLNLYCKTCIRQKIAHSRQLLREYKAARSKTPVSTQGAPVAKIEPGVSPRRIARLLRKLSPSDRVREAIRLGARTQKDIARVTRLPKDEVCDALANLLLWTREVRTEMKGGIRSYFIRQAEGMSQFAGPANRKENVRASFSSVDALIPGQSIPRKTRIA